jgi:hypothetical protein
MCNGQEYDQLKTELKDCVRDRNNLNTFTITTFFVALGLACKYASDKPYLFLLAQIFMIPILWRIMNHKKTEYRLSKVIWDKYEDPWEEKRSDSNTFYFEFLTLSLLVTAITVYFLAKALCGSVGFLSIIVPVACLIGSSVVSVVIGIFSYKSSKLSTENCDKSWHSLFFGDPK